MGLVSGLSSRLSWHGSFFLLGVFGGPLCWGELGVALLGVFPGVSLLPRSLDGVSCLLGELCRKGEELCLLSLPCLLPPVAALAQISLGTSSSLGALLGEGREWTLFCLCRGVLALEPGLWWGWWVGVGGTAGASGVLGLYGGSC